MNRNILACIFLLLNTTHLFAQTRIAFVGGVERYKKSGLKDLDYAEDDARQVKSSLEKLDSKTIAVIGEDAALAKLNSELEQIHRRLQEAQQIRYCHRLFSGTASKNWLSVPMPMAKLLS